MKRIHIVGKKGHGKTTLVTELAKELVSRGLAIGTIKHSPHEHEPDTPGKDSYQHRQAGGNPVTFMAENVTAVYIKNNPNNDPYKTIANLYNNCDLVLVEGDLENTALKIEVWRHEVDPQSFASKRNDISAIVTNDPTEVNIPVLKRTDIGQIAQYVIELI